MGVANNHAVVSQQSIEQTRLTCIGRPVNHHAHAFAQKAALVGSREQDGNLFTNGTEPVAQHFAFIGSYAFLWEID
jgi:hypothetical protein